MWFFSFEWGYSKWLKRPTNESAVGLVGVTHATSSIPGKVFRWYCQGVVVCTLHKDYGTFLEEGREGVSVSVSVRVWVSVSVRVWECEGRSEDESECVHDSEGNAMSEYESGSEERMWVCDNSRVGSEQEQMREEQWTEWSVKMNVM